MRNVPWLRGLLLLFMLASFANAQEMPLPRQFDLRKTGGITPIKSQKGGTC